MKRGVAFQLNLSLTSQLVHADTWVGGGGVGIVNQSFQGYSGADVSVLQTTESQPSPLILMRFCGRLFLTILDILQIQW